MNEGEFEGQGNITTFAMEYFCYLKWKDSTLPAYLNSIRSESILVADQFQIAAYNEKHPEDPLNVLNEIFFGFFDSLFNFKTENSAESTVFEKASIMLRENGIIYRIMSKYIDSNNLKAEPPPHEPKTLTLSHLGFGFEIYFLCLMLTLILLLFEIIVMRISLAR